MGDLELTTETDLGGSTTTQLTKIADHNDADGLAVADFDGDGKLDVVSAGGVNADIDLHIQGASYTDWTTTSIITSTGEFEGLAAGDIDNDGKVEVFVADQADGTLQVAKQDTSDPTGTWTLYDIDLVTPNIQTIRLHDIDDDGNTDVFIANVGATAGEGGWFWYDYDGGDPTDSASYTKHTMFQQEGAWWIDYQPRDYSGDGNADDWVVSGRIYPNDDLGTGSTRTGVFWLEPPADVTTQWTLNTIDTDHANVHAVTGDITNDGTPKDILTTNSGQSATKGAWWYEFTGSGTWTRNTITSGGDAYQGAHLRPNDAFLANRTQDRFERWEWDGSSYVYAEGIARNKVNDDFYDHDFSGDGKTEFVGVSAATGTVDIYEEVQNGGTIDITVYEDVGDDGSGANTDPNGKSYDNSDTVTLSGGAETHTLSGFDAGTGNAYWVEAVMDTQTVSGVSISSISIDSQNAVETESASLIASASLLVTESLPDLVDWVSSIDWERSTHDGTTASGGALTLESDATDGEAITDDEPL